MKPVIVCILLLVSCLLFASNTYAKSVTIKTGTSRGPLQTLSGVGVASTLSADAATDAVAFLGTGGLVAFINPSTAVITSAPFQQIVNAGMIPYVSFDTQQAASQFLTSFFASFAGKKIIANLNAADAGGIKNLTSQFPQAEIHGGGIWWINRGTIKGLNGSGVWPGMKALSVRLKPTSGSVFKDANLMLDTLFDMQKDIDGGTGTKMSFPSGSKLAVSEISAGTGEGNRAWRHAVTGAMFATSVQGGSAPVRYVVVSNFDTMNRADREVVGRMLKVSNTKPVLAWPDAFGGNGDPYDNTFSDQWNSDPIMGVVMNANGGKVFYIVNASNDTVSVSLEGAQANYNYVSTTGTRGALGGTSITMAPYETRFIAPSIDSAPVVPTTGPTTPPTQIPTTIPTTIPTVIPTATITTIPSPTSTPLSGETPVPTSIPTIVNPTISFSGNGNPLEQKPQEWKLVLPKVNAVAVAKTADKALQSPIGMLQTVAIYDTLLQQKMQTWQQMIEAFFHRTFKISTNVSVYAKTTGPQSPLQSYCSKGYYNFPAAPDSYKDCSRSPFCGGKNYEDVEGMGYDYNRCLGDGKKGRSAIIYKGLMPMCCYALEQTGVSTLCTWPERAYCLPSQCDKVKGAKNNCGYSLKTWAGMDGLDAKNIQYIPLSERGNGLNVPAAQPTQAPTPTSSPTTVVPTQIPTSSPTVAPTIAPTAVPTIVPTAMPTTTPTTIPTILPSGIATIIPTTIPTTIPTILPTAIPTPLSVRIEQTVKTVAKTSDRTLGVPIAIMNRAQLVDKQIETTVQGWFATIWQRLFNIQIYK